MAHDTRLCTLRDLAQRYRRYGLTATFIKREAESGRIPSLRVGRKFLFDAEAVEASLLERAQAGIESGAAHAG